MLTSPHHIICSGLLLNASMFFIMRRRLSVNRTSFHVSTTSPFRMWKMPSLGIVEKSPVTYDWKRVYHVLVSQSPSLTSEKISSFVQSPGFTKSACGSGETSPALPVVFVLNFLAVVELWRYVLRIPWPMRTFFRVGTPSASNRLRAVDSWGPST